MPSPSKTIAALAAGALVATSTAAAAAPAVPAQAPAPSAWVVLSTLSPTSDVALGGATTAAAQPAEVPPPPPPGPPPPPVGAGPVITGELLAILLWFGLIAVALGTHEPTGRPNSPG